MKKKLVLLLCAAMIVSLAGCGLRLRDRSETDNSDKEETDNDDSVAETITIKAKDGIATFSVTVNEPIASDSWLGICEEDEYVYEADADEYDIAYTYPDNYFDENGNPQAGPYTYIIDYSYIDEGDYTLVMTSTDNDGYVIFYAPCTVKNGKLKVATDEIVYNSRPDDVEQIEVYYPGASTTTADPDEYTYNPDEFTYDPDETNLPSGYDGTTSSPSGGYEYNSDPLEYATAVNTNVSETDAVGTSIRNDTLVLKYTGTENVCGESALYYVLGGFYDNGDVNWVTGTSRFWYFFDNETSYFMAFEAAKANDDLIIKEYNPVSHYFSVIGFFRNDWETYDEIVYEVNEGILPAEIPPSPDYMVVQ